MCCHPFGQHFPHERTLASQSRGSRMVNCLPEDGGGSRPRFRGSKKQAVATTDALRDGLRDLLRDGLVTRDVSQTTNVRQKKVVPVGGQGLYSVAATYRRDWGPTRRTGHHFGDRTGRWRKMAQDEERKSRRASPNAGVPQGLSLIRIPMRQENTLCKMLTTRHATRAHPDNPGDPYPHETHTRDQERLRVLVRSKLTAKE